MTLEKKGRWLSTLFLLLGVICLLMNESSPLVGLAHRNFDLYQQLKPYDPGKNNRPVVIVSIDEKSLRSKGQWPWPRSLLAELINTIGEHGAAAIGLDFYMPEPDKSSPDYIAQQIHDDQLLSALLARQPGHDALLKAAIAQNPVVLGAVGVTTASPATDNTFLNKSQIDVAGPPLRVSNVYPKVIGNLLPFQRAATGQALLNTELEDGRVRRIPVLMNALGQLLPSMPLELLRVGYGAEHITLDNQDATRPRIQIGELTLPIQSSGEIWLHFAPGQTDRYYSAERVLNQELGDEIFKDKIVLIGLTGVGLQDQRLTPLGETVPGVEIQAQMVEALHQGHVLERPFWAPWIEVFLLVSVGLAMLWRAQQRRFLAFGGLLLAAIPLLTIFCLIAFSYGGLLFDLFSITAVWLLIGLSGGLAMYAYTQEQRQEAEHQLGLEREQAARIAGELDAARRIQLGSLPDPTLFASTEHRCQIAAILEPAREVGGDLYDFVMMDKERLFFTIGDVSGKGLPASLFMAVTKALMTSCALDLSADRSGHVKELSNLVLEAHRQIARENPAQLFVTLVAGILNLNTGQLQLLNAGHDAPLRLSTDGTLDILTAASGPPLCVWDDFEYPVDHIQLRAGETICLITDGITEAMNVALDLYGQHRLMDLLKQSANSNGTDPQQLLTRINESVKTFVNGHPSSDDLTVLIIRWNGPNANTSV